MTKTVTYHPKETTSSAAIIQNAATRANKGHVDVWIQVPRRGLFGPVKQGSNLSRLADQTNVVAHMRLNGRDIEERRHS